MLNLTPAFNIYARRRLRYLSKLDNKLCQQQQLFKLLKIAKATSFGIDHKFSKINSILDYQNQVPLRKYEDIWNEYWKKEFPVITNCSWPDTISFFCVSSGTSSGTTKYLPYTKEMSRSNTKAGLDILVHHTNNKPDSKILGGLNFMLGGSTVFKEEHPGIFSGDLSGIAAKQMPWWIRPRYFPPAELAMISDWEKKIQIFAEESFKKDIRMISGVPSWLLIFIDKLQELRPNLPRKLKSYFPNLELVIHGGVNFSPYINQFRELLEGSNVDLREVYPASEGFIAIGDGGYGEGLRLITDHGIFYEFVPVDELDSKNPTRHWVGNVETGVNYAIVLTTCAGLFSYIIGDTVRFVSLSPLKLLITGRTSYSLSAFGEHLIAEEVEDAVSNALNILQLSAADYCVGAIYPEKAGDLGGHRYFIEVNKGETNDESQKKLSQLIDQRLSERNEDYHAHRAEGFGLNAPEVVIVPAGFFAGWMKSRGKLGGQNKVPRLISNPELFKDICGYASSIKSS